MIKKRQNEQGKPTQQRERRVHQRTKQLAALNQKLKQTHQKLQQAQRIARVGQWERDLKTDLVIWSDKIPNICQGLSNFSAPCDAERLFYSTPR